jgi:SpoVK/Ycf46/Vps4 family AAA+-type ATPase
MEQLNLNLLLNRLDCEKTFIEVLNNFELNKQNKIIKRGIYIYGAPGSGKSYFVKQMLKKMNYDIVMYDAGDVRNKSVIDMITKHNMSDINVLSLFNKKKKPIAIVMDEIDGMNNGDKGGINSLIKLIRPKKTNKQKKEQMTMLPIICIGNYHIDKKIKEIIKISTPIELKKPKNEEINNILNILMPNINTTIQQNLIDYIEGDLRKLNSSYEIYLNHTQILKTHLFHNIFKKKNFNEDTKDITKRLINNYYPMSQHFLLMNETDRTSVGLLFHENLIDYLSKIQNKKYIQEYVYLLENFVFSDYIDRITFQKQIWIFNEMTSLLKTFYNNFLFHKKVKNKVTKNINEIRFTKVLTKYSTEYNNITFIQTLCNKLNMDKKDLFSYFLFLKQENKTQEIIYDILASNNYDITKLEVSRLYRFLDKYYAEYDSNE